MLFELILPALFEPSSCPPPHKKVTQYSCCRLLLCCSCWLTVVSLCYFALIFRFSSLLHDSTAVAKVELQKLKFNGTYNIRPILLLFAFHLKATPSALIPFSPTFELVRQRFHDPSFRHKIKMALKIL